MFGIYRCDKHIYYEGSEPCPDCQPSAASVAYDLNNPTLEECLRYFYPALKRAVEGQQKAWFRDAGAPPRNILVEWRTSMDTAQMLVTEIERMMESKS